MTSRRPRNTRVLSFKIQAMLDNWNDLTTTVVSGRYRRRARCDVEQAHTNNSPIGEERSKGPGAKAQAKAKHKAKKQARHDKYGGAQ